MSSADSGNSARTTNNDNGANVANGANGDNNTNSIDDLRKRIREMFYQVIINSVDKIFSYRDNKLNNFYIDDPYILKRHLIDKEYIFDALSKNDILKPEFITLSCAGTEEDLGLEDLRSKFNYQYYIGFIKHLEEQKQELSTQIRQIENGQTEDKDGLLNKLKVELKEIEEKKAKDEKTENIKRNEFTKIYDQLKKIFYFENDSNNVPDLNLYYLKAGLSTLGLSFGDYKKNIKKTFGAGLGLEGFDVSRDDDDRGRSRTRGRGNRRDRETDRGRHNRDKVKNLFTHKQGYKYDHEYYDLLEVFDIKFGIEGNNPFANINLICYKGTEKISITLFRLNYYDIANLPVYYKITSRDHGFKWDNKLPGKELIIKESDGTTKVLDENDYNRLLSNFLNNKGNLNGCRNPSEFTKINHSNNYKVISFLGYITKLSYYKNYTKNNIMNLFHKLNSWDLLNGDINQKTFDLLLSLFPDGTESVRLGKVLSLNDGYFFDKVNIDTSKFTPTTTTRLPTNTTTPITPTTVEEQFKNYFESIIFNDKLPTSLPELKIDPIDRSNSLDNSIFSDVGDAVYNDLKRKYD